MAMLKRNRKAAILLLLALMMVLGTAVVHAITIVIDGIEEAVWISGSGGQTPGTATDSNEAPIPDDADIERVRYTNDQVYFYILIKTFGTPSRWDTVLANRVDICMDTDNNTGTGGTYVNCPGMSGIDRTIRITPYFSLNTFQTELQFLVYNGIFVNPVAGGNSEPPNVELATQGDITEMRLTLASLGLNSAAACSGQVNINVYFDGGTTDPDDNLPDSGAFPANCGSPTAVTLQSITTSSSPVAALSVAAVLMLAVVSAGFVLYRRQGQAR